MREVIYYISGMHCASCELVIERSIVETFSFVRVVDVSLSKGKIILEIKENSIENSLFINRLNELFKEKGYVFSEKKTVYKHDYTNEVIIFLGVLFGLILIVGLMQRTNLFSSIVVDGKSSLMAFFILGIIAGFSTCAALVGGILVSLSHQWAKQYDASKSFFEKMKPHLFFSFGRVCSYAFFGFILGLIGSWLKISPFFYAYIAVFVALIMIFLGLQMLGISFLRKFQVTCPKWLVKYFASQKTSMYSLSSFLFGAATVLLPCGFTLTVQGLAVISANPLSGALMLGIFALGTIPSLLLISSSLVSFFQKSQFGKIFSKIAAVGIILFGLYTLQGQLTVLGFSPLISLSDRDAVFAKNDSINEKQIIKMQANRFGYTPSYFKVKKGIPVVWEIEDKGASGCTNIIISPALFDGEIALTSSITKKEFFPKKEGKFGFSCWMGMAQGIIEVVN